MGWLRLKGVLYTSLVGSGITCGAAIALACRSSSKATTLALCERCWTECVAETDQRLTEQKARRKY
jgi:hypothetical protein